MYYSFRPQNGITLSGVKKVCNGKLTNHRDLNLFFPKAQSLQGF